MCSSTLYVRQLMAQQCRAYGCRPNDLTTIGRIDHTPPIEDWAFRHDRRRSSTKLGSHFAAGQQASQPPQALDIFSLNVLCMWLLRTFPEEDC